MAGRPGRDLGRDQGRDPRRDGRDTGPATPHAPPQTLQRALLRPTAAHLGLGDPALCVALARQLGHRRPRRPPPLRPLVEKTRRLPHPPQPARRADTDTPLRAVALLRLVPALSQRALSKDRGRRRRGQSRRRHDAPALNQQLLIDDDQVFELKTKALEAIFQVAPEPQGLAGWVRRQGQALRDFATFNALAEERGKAWRSWPAQLRHPRNDGILPSRRRLAARIAFHEWQQFHLDRQLARASREIGLVTDVPVGFASDGFDAWRWQDLLAPGIRVGAPPQEFFRDAQDWGLPAFNPWKLSGARWEPFIDAIRSAATHAAGVRLDHVMGLFRLFWIPDGMTAAQGAYVRYPAATLLALLANESRRADAFVVGEDLGLVQPAVRRHLRRRGSLSYRLLWFEGAEPKLWPRDAVAAVGTHDLPTVAGIWTGREPEHRLHHLREKLVTMTHLPDATGPVDVAIAAYTELARGRPRIVLASLEDALGVPERPNVPGTTTEFPNWRLALPASIEEIETADGVNRIANVMGDARRSANVSKS